MLSSARTIVSRLLMGVISVGRLRQPVPAMVNASAITSKEVSFVAFILFDLWEGYFAQLGCEFFPEIREIVLVCFVGTSSMERTLPPRLSRRA